MRPARNSVQVFVFGGLKPKGLKATEIFTEMLPVYGQKCFTPSIIHRWCNKFSKGRKSLVDEKRPGRQVVATNNDIANRIDAGIRSDRRVSVSDIVPLVIVNFYCLRVHSMHVVAYLHFLFNFCDSK